MGRLLSVAILLFAVFFIVRLINRHAPDLPEEDDLEELVIDARQRAIELLKDEGYQILSMRDEISCAVQVGDEQLSTELVADFTVRRGGQTYVVKMRQGDEPVPENADELRRELLPYYLLYRPASVLYLDPKEETMRVIQFDIQERRT